ncbi:Amino acid permease [Nitrospira tepida]|uniref:Amino acid permease n=1 Tax=Nitrospira tepida TaxID=2973512 RepID=A0AA86N428_9BACT|nr:amino acid permease [Nitrospira tepida]CAI4034176.1 Amino acid permease [Nitrospira tepida]
MPVTESPHTRQVGWFTAACLLISNMIGGGIFTTTGFLARDLGDPPAILFLWIVGAAVSLAGALCYAELGTVFPQAGGDYVYLREAYGPLPAFLSGWTSFTVGFGAAIAASAVSFATYLVRALPLTGLDSGWITGLALALVWSLTAVHGVGLQAGGRLQQTLTTIKVLSIAGLILGGLLFGKGSWGHLQTSPDAPGVHGGVLVASFVFVFYTYLGWNVAGYIAGEIRDPVRTLPRIMIGGTLFVGVVYLCLNLLYFFALPVDRLGEPPLLPVAEKAATALWGSRGAFFAALLLAISIAGAVSAMVWAGPRVYWAMAVDGALLPWFGVRHQGTGIPVRSMVLQSTWVSFLILTSTFEQLVVYGGLVLAGFSALTIAAVMLLRRRRPELTRPFRVPLYPFLPILVILVLLTLIAHSLFHRPGESLMGLLTVMIGVPLYWLMGRRTKRERSADSYQ